MTPVLNQLKDLLNHCSWLLHWSPKGPIVALVPNGPSSCQRVEGFVAGHRNALSRSQPPFSQEVMVGWGASVPTKVPQNFEPDLLEKTHQTKRWFCLLFAVQHLPRSANQMENLQLLGAFVWKLLFSKAPWF
jgi:hypothetical protein